MPVLLAKHTVPSYPLAGPILQSVAVQNPDGTANDQASLKWYVARTKSRQERKFARALNEVGVTYFLPYTYSMAKGQNRDNLVASPLFDGYAFFYGVPTTVFQARATRALAEVLVVPMSAQPALIADLEMIRLAMQFDPHVKAAYPALSPSTNVWITRGVLRGFEGKVDHTSPNKVHIACRTLGREVVVEVPRSHVARSNHE